MPEIKEPVAVIAGGGAASALPPPGIESRMAATLAEEYEMGNPA